MIYQDFFSIPDSILILRMYSSTLSLLPCSLVIKIILFDKSSLADEPFLFLATYFRQVHLKSPRR